MTVECMAEFATVVASRVGTAMIAGPSTLIEMSVSIQVFLCFIVVGLIPMSKKILRRE